MSITTMRVERPTAAEGTGLSDRQDALREGDDRGCHVSGQVQAAPSLGQG